MSRIALIAALPGELQPLVRGWRRLPAPFPVFQGRIGPAEVLAACAGMGSAAATRACEVLLHQDRKKTGAHDPIGALVSIGWAGSLSCGLRPPEASAIREVVDAATGERFLTQTPLGQRLITLGRVAGPEEKRRLATEHQAALVDMEAAAVARCARQHSLAFFCFKAVTDGPTDRLPDFNRFTAPDGRLRLPAFLAWTALQPQTWPALWRLGQNSRQAAAQLALTVRSFAENS